MTPDNAKGLVIGAAAGAGILSSAENVAAGKLPDVRSAVGVVVVAAVLYALADWQPNFAAAFALVLLVGAILTNGVAVANVITGATAAK